MQLAGQMPTHKLPRIPNRSTTPLSLYQAMGRPSFRQSLDAYAADLNILFGGQEGISQLGERHPLARRLRFLHEFAADKYPTVLRPQVLDALVQFSLDRAWRAGPSFKDRWAEVDPVVRTSLRSRLVDPSQFDATMTEVTLWAHFRQQNVDADFVGEEGRADLRLQGEVPVEVKRAHTHPTQKAIKRRVATANKQIRNSAAGGSGIMVLQVAAMSATRQPHDEAQIDVYEAELTRLLRRHYRSIAQVYLLWDDYVLLGEAPEYVALIPRRRVRMIHHEAPHGTVDMNEERFLPIVSTGVQFATDQTVPATPFTYSSVRVGKIFRRQSRATQVVSEEDARGALSAPTAIATYDLGPTRIVLATKRVTKRPWAPHTLLVVGEMDDRSNIEIALGYRLTDPPDQTAAEQVTMFPLAAFLSLLDRYGLPIWVADQRSTFIPLLATDDLEPGSWAYKNFTPPGSAAQPAGIRRDERGYVAWMHSIDLKPYLRDLGLLTATTSVG